MALRIAIGLAVTVVGLGLVAWRAWFLFRLVSTGRPAPGRMRHVGAQLKAELMDVFGQRKLLRRPLPGMAHFFVFWGFIILMFTIIEAYGDLFSKTFAIPSSATARRSGFLEDLFAVGVLFGPGHLHHHPHPPEPGPARSAEPLLRVAHLGGLGRCWA